VAARADNEHGGADDAARRLDALTPERRALLREALRRRARSDAVPRRTGSGPAPLSFSQQRIWFLEQWDPGAPTHHGARAVRLVGDLDRHALERALAAIVERHESLRTVFFLEGREPRQRALEEWTLPLSVVDLRTVPVEDRESRLETLLREESRRPFDLRSDVMLRPTLITLGADEHVLLLVLHHIASDAASDRVLNRELAELYGAFVDGREPELPELPIQYADYAVWQRERLQGGRLDELVAYWRLALLDAPPRLRLPTDRARPAVQRHRGVHRYVSYEGLGAAVATLAREEGVTVFMTLLAAFDVLLYRFTGQDDVVVGSPVAGRNHTEIEPLIGFFTNTLVLRNRLRGNPTFREVLARVRESTTGAIAHQELPFEKIVEVVNVERDPAFNPLFQVNFRAQPAPPPPLTLPGLTTTSTIPVDIGFSRFDLALELRVDGDALEGYFEYDEDLFDAATVDGLAHDFEHVVRAVASSPSTPLLSIAGSPGSSRPHAIRRIPRNPQ
jgi:hypothetical protein